MSEIEKITKEMILEFGFRARDENAFSKLVHPKRRPPFYIKILKSELNDTDWYVLGKGVEIVSLVETRIQLEMALLVICWFDRNCGINFQAE
jgi:hypothetical protein